jgi:hypothetical protein
MTECAPITIDRRMCASLLAAALLVIAPVAGTARAADVVTLSITMKDYKFDPPELHAPAEKQIAIHVKNLNPIVSEFESSDLHFEKIVPAGSEAVVYVRPLKPGRYNFYDDFHHATQGYLVVP